MINELDTKWRYIFVSIPGLCVGAYIGSMLATIYVILARRESLNSIDPLDPWFLRYSWATMERNPDTLNVALLITIGTALALTAIGISGVYRGKLTEYDDSHFQTKGELKRNNMLKPFGSTGLVYGKLGGPENEGLYLSGDPGQFPHCIMTAPTRSGKGAGFVIPNLMIHSGSAIVLDVKGENFEATAVHRQKGLNNKIWYFSPFDYVDDERGGRTTRTHRFNPLQRIAEMKSAPEQYTALNTLTDQFLVAQGESAQGFFRNGKRLFVASCLYAIEQGRPTIGYASEIMGGGGNRAESYRTYATTSANETVQRVFLEMSGETQKILDSYISVINGAGLELWTDPSVDRATSASDFTFNEIRSTPQTLYIKVLLDDIPTLAPLIRLIFSDAIACLQRSIPTKDEPHTVLFLMDEFDALGHQPMVLRTLKTIAGYGGRFAIITQSIVGLETVYSEAERRSILAGCGIQIYKTPQDDLTASVIEKALGTKTIEAKTESNSRIRELSDSANISRRSEQVPLITAASLLKFSKDKVIVFAEAQFPIVIDHIKYFRDLNLLPILKAQKGHPLPYPPLDHGPDKSGQITTPNRPTGPLNNGAGVASAKSKPIEPDMSKCEQQTRTFNKIKEKSEENRFKRRKRRDP